MVDTSDEWIIQRTGIRERHIAADDESTSDLALQAARSALEQAGLGVEAMASPAACRTYNVLLSEGRRVGLALLPVAAPDIAG